jgi:membrane protease YdiL (CAAX protease family)
VRELQIAALLSLGCLFLLRAGGRLDFLDREFPSRRRRITAGTLLFLILTLAVFQPAVTAGQAMDIDPRTIWFPSIFAGHLLLTIFLLAWWRLQRRDSLLDFLRLRPLLLADVERGLWVGATGWLLAIVSAAILGYFIGSGGMAAEKPEIPEFMRWLANLPVLYKLSVVAAAMTVEEAFFRAFLQTRLGWIPSTLLFAIAHASYGMPTLVVGVFVISLVIGKSLEDTGRLLPCIVAHGVFDAIQLIVIIPIAVHALGAG